MIRTENALVARMDGRWVTAEALWKGKEAPQSLVLGVARQMDSEAPAHGEAFAAALTFIKVVLGALENKWWRHMAVDIEAPVEARAAGTIVASLHWG